MSIGDVVVTLLSVAFAAIRDLIGLGVRGVLWVLQTINSLVGLATGAGVADNLLRLGTAGFWSAVPARNQKLLIWLPFVMVLFHYVAYAMMRGGLRLIARKGLTLSLDRIICTGINGAIAVACLVGFRAVAPFGILSDEVRAILVGRDWSAVTPELFSACAMFFCINAALSVYHVITWSTSKHPFPAYLTRKLLFILVCAVFVSVRETPLDTAVVIAWLLQYLLVDVLLDVGLLAQGVSPRLLGRAAFLVLIGLWFVLISRLHGLPVAASAQWLRYLVELVMLANTSAIFQGFL